MKINHRSFLSAEERSSSAWGQKHLSRRRSISRWNSTLFCTFPLEQFELIRHMNNKRSKIRVSINCFDYYCCGCYRIHIAHNILLAVGRSATQCPFYIHISNDNKPQRRILKNELLSLIKESLTVTGYSISRTKKRNKHINTLCVNGDTDTSYIHTRALSHTYIHTYKHTYIHIYTSGGYLG